MKQRIFKEIERLQKEYEFPGATVSYILADGNSNSIAYGLADLETGQPMTNESRMLAASIGKTFVAATVIALEKEGRLSFAAPLSKWLGSRSWYPRLPNFQSITLRHLLTHSAGIPNHVFDKKFLQNKFQINTKNIPETLISFILDQDPLFETGDGWSYSDTGYILLGLVIEEVTGRRYHEELIQRFLQPLNLIDTAPSDQKDLKGLAAGYTDEDNIFGVPRKTVDAKGVLIWNPAIEWTGGGLISSSRDLAHWAKLLYEGKVIEANYLDDLLQSVPTGKGDARASYGMGVIIDENESFGLRYGHYGVIPGYTTIMRYYPEQQVAYAFQVNTDIGVWNHSTELLNSMEKMLAEVLLGDRTL